ncbi:hypothetical protein PYCCODRAFT_1465711 [Trametes coccinea BRFM310]|uniref:Uncharacterized protein n=1 Tax=Trametes coccinea (strain BRFM310) TaxID=1353009 RepID=A0A1Y2IVQ8_TRAC3|nr:hypothetical protein PYCCODRAFT_1465711 [Trametes coccinea BRFM310]
MRAPSVVPPIHHAPDSMPATKLIVYGSRIPHLVARTSDGSGADASQSSAPSSGPVVSPIVPALIAVAVFILSSLVILKAVRSLRGGSGLTIYRKAVEEEKPQLWEVSLSEKATPIHDAGTWSEMMPISVGYLPTDDSPTLARPPSVATTSSSSSCSRPRSRTWSLSPPRIASRPVEPDDEARLHVAVLIAMPSPSGNEPRQPAPAYLGLAEA